LKTFSSFSALVVMFVGLIGLAPSPASAQLHPFEIGEKLVYLTMFNFVKSGQSTMEILGQEIIDGHAIYRVRSQTQTAPFFDKLYRIRDDMESWIDVKTLFSRRFQKKLAEGNYRKEYAVRFDYQKMQAISATDIDTLTSMVHDPLSIFYFLRAESLYVGRIFKLFNYDNDKLKPYNIIVKRIEKVNVPAGEFVCFVLEPFSKDGKLFKHQSQVTIYVSTDERHLPVMISSDASIGKMILRLEKF